MCHTKETGSRFGGGGSNPCFLMVGGVAPDGMRNGEPSHVFSL